MSDHVFADQHFDMHAAIRCQPGVPVSRPRVDDTGGLRGTIDDAIRARSAICVDPIVDREVVDECAPITGDKSVRLRRRELDEHSPRRVAIDGCRRHDGERCHRFFDGLADPLHRLSARAYLDTALRLKERAKCSHANASWLNASQINREPAWLTDAAYRSIVARCLARDGVNLTTFGNEERAIEHPHTSDVPITRDRHLENRIEPYAFADDVLP